MKLRTRWKASAATVTAVAAVLTATPTAAHADAPGASTGAEHDLSTDGITWRLPSSGADPRAYPVSYCAGTFYGPKVVNNTLEWGAQQTCENPRDRPQAIIVRLESTCDGVLCIKFKEEARARNRSIPISRAWSP